MKITTGTNCFPSHSHACFYYSNQMGGFPSVKEIEKLVDYKLKMEEIKIGSPELKAGQEKKLVDNRWHICE